MSGDERSRGVPLVEALLRFGDQEDVSRVRELRSLGADSPLVSLSRDSVSQAHDRQQSELLKLNARLVESFARRLREGALVASGFVAPLSPQSRRERINAALWEMLEPDFEQSSAGAEGIAWLKVLVSEPRTVAHARSMKDAETQCGRWLTELSVGSKPASKDAIYQEARARFGEGLSRRAFERQWSRAVPDDWKQPGKSSQS